MALSMIYYRHLRQFHDQLPPQYSSEYIGSVFSNETIREVFRGVRSWRVNPLLEPAVYPALPRETFVPPTFQPTPSVKPDHFNEQGCMRGVRKPLNYYQFENVYLIQNGGGFFIFDEDGVSPFSTVVPNFEREDCPPPPLERVDFGFFLGDRFSPENLCHFTFDYMGRAILALEALQIDEKDLFFPAFDARYSRHIFKSVTPQARMLERSRSYFFRKLLMFDQTCGRIEHPARHCDVRVLSRLRAAINAPETHWRKNDRGPTVYLNRLGEKRRPCANESELVTQLKSRGVASINPGHLSPDEQLELISTARTIISPHGAGLTSLIAARPGAKVVELFNPKEGTLAYCQLAFGLGLDYDAIIGKSNRADEKSWLADVPRTLQFCE